MWVCVMCVWVCVCKRVFIVLCARETGITKRICFRLQSTWTVWKCQRRRRCTEFVCVCVYASTRVLVYIIYTSISIHTYNYTYYCTWVCVCMLRYERGVYYIYIHYGCRKHDQHHLITDRTETIWLKFYRVDDQHIKLLLQQWNALHVLLDQSVRRRM